MANQPAAAPPTPSLAVAETPPTSVSPYEGMTIKELNGAFTGAASDLKTFQGLTREAATRKEQIQKAIGAFWVQAAMPYIDEHLSMLKDRNGGLAACEYSPVHKGVVVGSYTTPGCVYPTTIDTGVQGVSITRRSETEIFVSYVISLPGEAVAELTLGEAEEPVSMQVLTLLKTDGMNGQDLADALKDIFTTARTAESVMLANLRKKDVLQEAVRCLGKQIAVQAVLAAFGATRNLEIVRFEQSESGLAISVLFTKNEGEAYSDTIETELGTFRAQSESTTQISYVLTIPSEVFRNTNLNLEAQIGGEQTIYQALLTKFS